MRFQVPLLVAGLSACGFVSNSEPSEKPVPKEVLPGLYVEENQSQQIPHGSKVPKGQIMAPRIMLPDGPNDTDKNHIQCWETREKGRTMRYCGTSEVPELGIGGEYKCLTGQTPMFYQLWIQKPNSGSVSFQTFWKCVRESEIKNPKEIPYSWKSGFSTAEVADGVIRSSYGFHCDQELNGIPYVDLHKIKGNSN